MNLTRSNMNKKRLEVSIVPLLIDNRKTRILNLINFITRNSLPSTSLVHVHFLSLA